MERITKCYSRLAASKQIAISFSTIMALAIILVSLCLITQLENTQNYQLTVPNEYFATQDQQSLDRINKQIRYCILDSLDMRRSLLKLIQMSLVDNKSKFMNSLPPKNNSVTSEYLQSIKCYFMANNSIFSCGMDSYTSLILLNANIYLQSRPMKRFNIYYQNNRNHDDIMIKILSKNITNLPNIDTIKSKFDSVKQNKFMFSSYFKDEFSGQSNTTSSYRTKIVFADYTVLLEAQSYGAFIKRALQRLLYSDSVNAIVMARNDTDPFGYSIISNLSELSGDINYSMFLTPRYYQISLSTGRTLYAYASVFSSTYDIDSKINVEKMDLAESDFASYILLIYSESTCKIMRTSIFSFITQMHEKMQQFVIVGIFLMLVLILIITSLMIRKINKGLSTMINSIHGYQLKPTNSNSIIFWLSQFYSKFLIFGQLFRSISTIINKIQNEKHKHKTRIQKYKKDTYPLNLFDSKFMKSQNHQTLIEINQIYNFIEFKQNEKKQQNILKRSV